MILCTFQITKIFQISKRLDNGGFVGTILMNLPKPDEWIPNELLIAELERYGIDNRSLQLLLDYLTNKNKGLN